MSGDQDALAILTLLGIRGVGPAKVMKALAGARAKGLSAVELVERPAELAGVLSPDQIHEVEPARLHAAELAAKVAQSGASLLAITDERYPATLGRQLDRSAPPLLTVLGKLSLLDEPSVGFCGSRQASDKGIATAGDCAGQLAEAGVAVVSGYAAGVDMAAHGAALRVGGSTTIVLAEGFLHFSVKRDIKDLWAAERIAVVSEFLPDSAWSVHNAMRRNHTICGLSRAMVLIEARATGGSMEAGRTCLDLGIPLFAAVYEGMPDAAEGNRQLVKAGARQLLKSRSSGRANVAPILHEVLAPLHHPGRGTHAAAAGI